LQADFSCSSPGASEVAGQLGPERGSSGFGRVWKGSVEGLCLKRSPRLEESGTTIPSAIWVGVVSWSAGDVTVWTTLS